MTVSVAFLGSPALAIPSLQALFNHPHIQIKAIFTQPDRPAGRGRTVQVSPVKAFGLEKEVPVYTPQRIADCGEWFDLDIEIAIVCAYGQLLPQAILAHPKRGCYNLHFSLLPRWRGASPMQAAILHGDHTTGVSIQQMVLKLDAGPLLISTPPLPIAHHDTTQTLGQRLAEASAALLSTTLPTLLSEPPPPLTPQLEEAITFCRQIPKSAGALDFAQDTAESIERKCRAYFPWPGCWSYWKDQRLGIHSVNLIRTESAQSQPAPQPIGILQETGHIVCASGIIQLEMVQPAGKKPMPWSAFKSGYAQAIGQALKPVPTP